MRATSVPNTTRCVSDVPLRTPTFLPEDTYTALGPGFRTIDCYLDYRVNEYILGEGPDLLTVLRIFYSYGRGWYIDEDGKTGDEQLEEDRQAMETAIGSSPANEEVLFLIPSTSLVTEEWEARGVYDVQRTGDDTIVAVHELRDLYRRRSSC